MDINCVLPSQIRKLKGSYSFNSDTKGSGISRWGIGGSGIGGSGVGVLAEATVLEPTEMLIVLVELNEPGNRRRANTEVGVENKPMAAAIAVVTVQLRTDGEC